MDFLPMLFILFGLISAYYLFSDIFGASDKVDSRPPPKSQAERRERREERERKLKAEYEEKKALKLKARNEKNKIYQEKKENERIAKEEKKRIAKENKKDFFNWLKPKARTHKLSNGNTIMADSNQIQKVRTHISFFGSENRELNSLDEKMDNLMKELKDL